MNAPDSDWHRRAIELTRMTLAGSAQTTPIMNTTCSTGMPACAVKAQKPTKDSIRINAGRLKMPLHARQEPVPP